MAAAFGQSFRPVHYVGEIGHLGTDFDPRTVADFGFAKVHTSGSDVRIEGKDDRGKPWQAVVPVLAGVTWTDLWRGDFDANSRQDLMIDAVSPGNGKCISEVTVTFLMFDFQGRPVPWTIKTFRTKAADVGKMPALLELGRNRRAQFIATGCEYSVPGFGEDRYITGIYTTRDARWKLVRPPDLKPYTDEMRRSYSNQFVHFVAAQPADWKDHGNSTTAYNTPVTITQVLRPEPECRGVRMPVVDGRVVPLPNPDPCDVLGKNRFETSGGNVCLGWPTIVQDGDGGREIVAAGSPEVESKLRELAAAAVAVSVIGQSDPKHCSPSLLWVNRDR